MYTVYFVKQADENYLSINDSPIEIFFKTSLAFKDSIL